jgi:hypothetical protein
MYTLERAGQSIMSRKQREGSERYFIESGCHAYLINTDFALNSSGYSTELKVRSQWHCYFVEFDWWKHIDYVCLVEVSARADGTICVSCDDRRCLPFQEWENELSVVHDLLDHAFEHPRRRYAGILPHF